MRNNVSVQLAERRCEMFGDTFRTAGPHFPLIFVLGRRGTENSAVFVIDSFRQIPQSLINGYVFLQTDSIFIVSGGGKCEFFISLQSYDEYPFSSLRYSVISRVHRLHFHSVSDILERFFQEINDLLTVFILR